MGVMSAILLSQFLMSVLVVIAARRRQMQGWARLMMWASLLLGVPMLGFMFVVVMPKKKADGQAERQGRGHVEAKGKGQDQKSQKQRRQRKGKGKGKSVEEPSRGQNKQEDVVDGVNGKHPSVVPDRLKRLFTPETPQQKRERLDSEIAGLEDRMEKERDRISALEAKDAAYRGQYEPNMFGMMSNGLLLSRAQRQLARDGVRLDDLRAKRGSLDSVDSGPQVNVHNISGDVQVAGTGMAGSEDDGSGRLFALGHGTMGESEFCEMLRKNGIDHVVDVRSLPVSRHSPHFCGGLPDAESGHVSNLERVLESAGVSYQWLGDRFGSHQRREEDQRKHVYVMYHPDGTVAARGIFADDDECNDHCVKHNSGNPDSQISSYGKGTAEDLRKYLDSSDFSPEQRAVIKDSMGDYLTYDEVRGRYDFQLDLANLRDRVIEGGRVLLLGRAADPVRSHCFSLLGRELAHPSDPLTEPMEVYHLTRDGRSMSQSQLERRMLVSQGLGSGMDDLDRGYRNCCSAIIGSEAVNSEVEREGVRTSFRV